MCIFYGYTVFVEAHSTCKSNSNCLLYQQPSVLGRCNWCSKNRCSDETVPILLFLILWCEMIRLWWVCDLIFVIDICLWFMFCRWSIKWFTIQICWILLKLNLPRVSIGLMISMVYLQRCQCLQDYSKWMPTIHLLAWDPSIHIDFRLRCCPFPILWADLCFQSYIMMACTKLR